LGCHIEQTGKVSSHEISIDGRDGGRSRGVRGSADDGRGAGAQQNYPSKPIRLIVPEVVGSAADLMSRIIGERIGEALGQPVSFENLFLEAGV
jgi:hypothetical protein